MTAPAPALAADPVAGLRRLKLARIRAIVPELCQAAKTQRWSPDEFLRTFSGGGERLIVSATGRQFPHLLTRASAPGRARRASG